MWPGAMAALLLGGALALYMWKTPTDPVDWDALNAIIPTIIEVDGVRFVCFRGPSREFDCERLDAE